MKFYRVWTRIYHNGKLICTDGRGTTLRNIAPVNKEYDITWDTLNENIERGYFNSRYYKKKKGRVFEIFTLMGGSYIFKEWKGALNLHGVVFYEEYTPSIQQVLEWPEGDKAIQYLVERGMSVTKG